MAQVGPYGIDRLDWSRFGWAFTGCGADVGWICVFEAIRNNSKPFEWTATADDILAKVQLVQTNIKKLVDNNGK